MTLTTEQVHEAIEQMLVDCDLKMENYESVSARGTLRSLGYDGENLEQVLQFIFDGGFTYCLDRQYHVSPSNDPGPISQDVCYWGPDQLASRLHSLSNYRAKTYVRRYSEI